MKMRKTIIGLGELLWDLLPSGERLGGAPANFAVMAARLGNHGVIASALGADARGEQALRQLSGFPIDLSFVQTISGQPTGTVGVEFHDGEPYYVIHKPAAWDFLEWTPEWQELAAQADAVCFSTLGQREPASRKTIRQFLAATSSECVRVCDVNLRPPFFSAEVIAESLEQATIFKLNEAEVPQVLAMLGGKAESDLQAAARWFLGKYPLQLVAITLGAEGSLLVTRDSSHRRLGIAGNVVDTVGAGDAFTAALVDAYLRGAGLATMNEAGNCWGSWIASHRGAMPELDEATLKSIQQAVSAA
jgi:fructokinase